MPTKCLPVINAFWIGPQMGRLHAACLQSFVRQGHRVVLHSYGPPNDTPKGVEIADASQIMPQDRMIAYRKSGSFALGANIFRLELMAKAAGLYVDCDCFCVRPIPDADMIFGLQDSQTINNAVLKLPPDSAVLAAMRTAGMTRGFIPPWEKSFRKIRWRIRSMLGVPVSVQDMKWGTLGPRALTYYSQEYGIFDMAKPSDVFYPVGYSQANLLRDPGLRIADLTTPRSQVVHLWNEVQRGLPEPPNNSPLHEVMETLEQ